MALTRLQIRTNVEAFTGKKNKTTEINTFCDLALREAMLRHTFRGAKSSGTVSLVQGDYSKAITSDLDEKTDIIFLRISDTSNNESIVEIKNEIWFEKNIGDPSQQSQGRPYFCYRKDQTTLIFDRPCDTNYTLTIAYSDLTPAFASDATECPISVLDIFVTYYCCASIYLSIADEKNYIYWMTKAVGQNLEDWQGGAFKAAVMADEKESGKVISKLDGITNPINKPAVYISDLDNSGVTRPWY